MVPDCLPANVPVTIRLHRAPASYGLLKLQDTLTGTKSDKTTQLIPFDFTEPVIPIMSPVLDAYYAFSHTLEAKMNRGRAYNNTIRYLDYQTRRQVLDQGLSEFQINLQVGKFPKYMFLVLSDMDRIQGSDTLSLTQFTNKDLESIDILIGNII